MPKPSRSIAEGSGTRAISKSRGWTRPADAKSARIVLAAMPKKRLSTVLDPAAAAKVAVARRAKPSPVPDHVRLALTLELRRELAEKLSLKAIKSERNIEAIIIGLIEAAAKQWR